MELKVKGHSGCVIDIVNEGNNLRIHKWSKDPKYLARLAKQADKQQKAYKDEYQHIRIPQIFDVERDDEHVLINMEYVYSRNFIEFFEAAGFEQIDYFIKALILFLEKELKASPVKSVPTSVTLDKYYDVEKKVNANPLLASDPKIQRLMALSRQRFEELAKQSTVDLPMGICHGDLTFSNILFNGNNYYLIDFLDSFIESPLLDIVKIRQDSAHLWSQLMYMKQYDKLRLKIISEKIDKEIHGYFLQYEWYKRYYNVYQILNFLRILQYAKEEKVIAFLKNTIEKLLTLSSVVNDEEKIVRERDNNVFSLIVPIAADDEDHPDKMPYVFCLDNNGVMLCVRAIQGLNLDVFDEIYFTILRKHAEKFYLPDLFMLQFKRLGIQNAHLVILDEPTHSQVETVYKTVIRENIRGGIFVKDADGYYKSDVRRDNSVALFTLEQLHMLDPQHKSYVSVDDMYNLTNIIERKVISHYFNAGGICFDNVDDFLYYYKQLLKENLHICMSHIVYSMLLDGKNFRPIITKDYMDWGSEMLFNYNYYTKQLQ